MNQAFVERCCHLKGPCTSRLYQFLHVTWCQSEGRSYSDSNTKMRWNTALHPKLWTLFHLAINYWALFLLCPHVPNSTEAPPPWTCTALMWLWVGISIYDKIKNLIKLLNKTKWQYVNGGTGSISPLWPPKQRYGSIALWFLKTLIKLIICSLHVISCTIINFYWFSEIIN